MNNFDRAKEIQKVYDKLSEKYDEMVSNADYGVI